MPEASLAGTLTLIGAFLALSIDRGTASAAPLWLDNAILLAFLVRRPCGTWPLYLACGYAGNYLGGTLQLHVPAPPLICLGNTIEVLIAGISVRHMAMRRPLDLSDTRTFLSFLLYCAILAPAISATFAGLAFHLSTDRSFVDFWKIWFPARSLGMIILAPLLFYRGWGEVIRLLRRGSRAETIGVLSVVAVVDLAVFAQDSLPLLFCAFPAVLLAAFRLGVVGAMIAALGTAVVAILFTLAGTGPMSLMNHAEMPWRIIVLQAFLAVLVLTTLQVAAVLAARRTLQRTLSESEERFRLLIEGVSDHAMYMLDAEGLVSSWNAAAERLKGYRKRDILGRHFETLFSEDDIADGTPQQMLGVAKVFGRFETEGLRLRRDGSTFWANIVINRVFDETGLLVGYAVITRDMTEHHRSQEQLSRENERYQAILQSSTDGICVIDQDGSLCEANDQFFDMLGHDPQGSARLGIEDWDADPTSAYAAIESLGIGNVPCLSERRFKHRDGSLIDVEIASRGVEIDSALYIYTSVRDITSRINTVEALRNSEEKFRTVAETAGEAIVTVEQDGRIIYANPAAGRIFAYPLDALIGRQIVELLPEGWDRQAGHQAAFDGSARECDGIKSSGASIALEFSVAPWTLNGQSLNTLILRDVSLRRLHQSHLAESIREKETLLREVYHRVKNNLQVIQSLLRISSRNLPPGAQRVVIDEAIARVRAMALVHEKLYQSPNLARIDLAEYVRDLLRQVADAYALDRQRIRMKADIAALDVALDSAVPLGLLINELVSNSAKHAFPDRARGEIVVSIQPTEHTAAQLVVSDSGVGLPASFDLSSVKSMGLSVATSLARQLGGELRIDPARNACFCVELANL